MVLQPQTAVLQYQAAVWQYQTVMQQYQTAILQYQTATGKCVVYESRGQGVEVPGAEGGGAQGAQPRLCTVLASFSPRAGPGPSHQGLPRHQGLRRYAYYTWQ